MPNTKSAKKRVRQTERRTIQNRTRRSTARTAEKKVRNLVSEGKISEAQEAYKAFTSAIDRAALRNIVHKNNASRKKSRLAQFIARSAKSA